VARQLACAMADRGLVSADRQDHRISGLLRLVEDGYGWNAEERTRLAREHAEAVRWGLQVEATFTTVARAFEARGLDYRVLKGLAAANLLYPEPALRSFGDLDLLVRPADRRSAQEALRSMATPSGPYHGPASEREDKSRTVVDRRGVEVDLHHSIQGWLYSSRISGDLLFGDPQPVAVGGREALALSLPAMLVNAALHVTTASWRLSTVADIALLVERVDPDDMAFLELVERRGVAQMVWWGLARAASWAPLPDHWAGALAANGPSPIRERWLRWLQASPARERTAEFVGAPERVRRAAELLWPQRAFLDRMGLTHAQHLSRTLRGRGSPVAHRPQPN
jgi:hypothetical protein